MARPGGGGGPDTTDKSVRAGDRMSGHPVQQTASREAVEEIGQRRTSRAPFGRRIRRSFASPMGAFGLGVMVLFVLVAAFAPFIAPYNPLAHGPDLLSAPSAAHWFGTDEYGRDTLSRVIWGARPALVVSVASVGLAAALAVPLGLTAGQHGGGVVDMLVMRLSDLLLGFPSVLLGIALITIMGAGEVVLAIVIAISSLPPLSRMCRSVALQTRDLGYVDAARMLGVRNAKILWRHILPNSFAPILIYSVIRMGTALLEAAGLSFLGLGIQPPTADWGQMLGEGKMFMFQTPWLGIFPGVALGIFVLGLTYLSDGLARGFNVKT